ncbi:hypothetical protein F4604DRAFT_1689833 [Suillus subluteus]|nr:hypothetical protein F4604DRAFT_1689833 [Suillus subluteus]
MSEGESEWARTTRMSQNGPERVRASPNGPERARTSENDILRAEHGRGTISVEKKSARGCERVQAEDIDSNLMAEFQYILYNTVNYMGPERSKHSMRMDHPPKILRDEGSQKTMGSVIVDAIWKEKALDSSSRLNKPQSAICIPVSEFLDVDFGHDDPVIGPGPSALNEPEVKAAVPTFNQDDIKIEYHPNFLVPPPDGQPWSPFKSRLEFEIAEIMLEVGFNNQQTDRLIKLCHRCAVGKEKLTFKNHKDIHNVWEAASHRITKFTKEVVSVPFTGDEELQEYDMHYRDLWELAADMLRNPWLFPHFTFDAHPLEPFTARDIWDVQFFMCLMSLYYFVVTTPLGAKPLAYILYADKTKLSSFGTAKGYPVYSSSKLTDCNSKWAGEGGGYVVGWLPIVKDEKLHSGKPSWVDFKNTVWHKSFARIISSLASKSQTGQWFNA